MNITNNQTVQNEKECCIDCKTSFTVAGGELVNNYKCHQKEFTSSDLWSIQKQRRQFTVNTTIRTA